MNTKILTPISVETKDVQLLDQGGATFNCAAIICGGQGIMTKTLYIRNVAMNSLVRLLFLATFALALPGNSQDNQLLTGTVKLACEAILCLSDPIGGLTSECNPALEYYFGIKFKRWAKTRDARLNFLSLCPLVGGTVEVGDETVEVDGGEPVDIEAVVDTVTEPGDVNFIPVSTTAEHFIDDRGNCYVIPNPAFRHTTPDGFVWKPLSEGDGNLVVLFPASSGASGASGATLYYDGGAEAGSFSGRTNGNRPTIRFSSSGSQYPTDLVVCER